MTTTSGYASNLDETLYPPDLADSYHRDGYVIVPRVFTATEVQRLADEADSVIASEASLTDVNNLRARFQPHVQTGELLFDVLDPFADLSPFAASVSRDRRILDVVETLYGERAQLFKDKLILKPPGACGASCHQDWISWPNFPNSFLTVVLAIDPFRPDNGGTQVYPGQHRRGYLSLSDGRHHSLDRSAINGQPLLLELAPGDIAIFSAFTPHFSDPNASDRPRRGYFLSYNAHSDGGDQYAAHYREFHQWIRRRTPSQDRRKLFFR